MDLNSVNITATQVAKNYFSAYVENGFIYSYSVYGERQQVGVTNDAYTALQKTAQEALDKAEKYYQRLVELGDIVPPKTSEETIAELMSVVSELRNEIREMKTVQHKGDSNESIKYTESSGDKNFPTNRGSYSKGTATLQLVDRCGNSVFSDQLKPRRIYDIRIHTASKLATVLCNLPKCTVGVTPVLNNPTTSTPAVSSKD